MELYQCSYNYLDTNCWHLERPLDLFSGYQPDKLWKRSPGLLGKRMQWGSSRTELPFWHSFTSCPSALCSRHSSQFVPHPEQLRSSWVLKAREGGNLELNLGGKRVDWSWLEVEGMLWSRGNYPGSSVGQVRTQRRGAAGKESQGGHHLPTPQGTRIKALLRAQVYTRQNLLCQQ